MTETNLLHISDLHFGRPFVPDVAEALLETAHELKADAVVVSGDLTQRAQRDQFIAAREFLGRFPSLPQLIVPGNHDVPLYNLATRLRDPLRAYREIISDELNPTLQLEQATLVGLDSTAPRSAISNGRIHPWQLQHCSQVFSAAPEGSVRIVVAHHHFAPAPDFLHDWTMPKSKRAIMRFVELDVELILGGHLHRSYIGNSLDFYPGSHREQGIVIAQCGTSTSQRGRGRERQKNTFNWISIDENRIQITHYLYFHHRGFVPTSSHQFFRSKNGDHRLRQDSCPQPPRKMP